MNEQRRIFMPCLDGGNHHWVSQRKPVYLTEGRYYDVGARDYWSRSRDKCDRCGREREDCWWVCRRGDCDGFAVGYWHTVTDPMVPRWTERIDGRVYRTYDTKTHECHSMAGCGSCVEAHRLRCDREIQLRWRLREEEDRAIRRLQDRERRRRESQDRWLAQRAPMLERRRQRTALREGARTLKAIRMHLRAPGRSLLAESRPERTSPTS